MTHSYIISGITCGSCVATIKAKLFLNPEITGVQITRGGLATISMRKHLGVKALQAIIGTDSKYMINESAAGSSHEEMIVDPAKSWSAPYKPLLVIAVYITGVSALLADGSFHAGMNYFMAGFFLVF